MIVVALVFAGIAAAIHIYIWVLESLIWTTPRARRVFGTSETDARQTGALAFNQGFYNLFLAVAALLGIAFIAAGALEVGATLVFVGTGSMVGAGLVLALSDRSKLRPALIQLVPPAVAVVTLAVGLAL